MRRCRTSLFAVLTCGLMTAVLPAQTTRSCPPVNDTLFVPCQIDTPSQRQVRPMPIYPAKLWEAGISGLVQIRYQVDTTGRVMEKSLQVVSSSNELFTKSVRQIVATWQLAPAMYQQRRVVVQREEVFQFIAPPSGEAHLMNSTLFREDTTAQGIPRTMLGAARADPGILFTEADLQEAQRNALLAIVAQISVDTPAIVCPSILVRRTRVSAPPALLLELTAGNRRAVSLGECPRTYADAIPRIDSLGKPVSSKPRGWINPHILAIAGIVPYSPTILLVTANLARESVSSHYECRVQRTRKGWEAACQVYSATGQ